MSLETRVQELERLVGTLTEALNDKVDLPTSVPQTNIDYVVESWTSGTSWYRVYKSGWVEQGGRTKASVAAGVTNVPLHKEMLNTNYNIKITDYATSTKSITFGFYGHTTTTLGVVCETSGRAFDWQVSGMGA